jgi:hypothetical protein
MKHLKRFENNEDHSGMREDLESKKMKQWVLNTMSESGDRYIYFIEHPTKPTSKELDDFLEENANDIYEGNVYEDVERITEIDEDDLSNEGFKRIP